MKGGETMKKFKAAGIDWDIDLDETAEYVMDSFKPEIVKEIFNIDKSAPDAEDAIKEILHHTPALAQEICCLPDTIELPEDVWKAAVKEKNCDAISDYISGVSGYCFNGYDLPKELEKMIDSPLKEAGYER